jgi:hypothetical protein
LMPSPPSNPPYLPYAPWPLLPFIGYLVTPLIIYGNEIADLLVVLMGLLPPRSLMFPPSLIFASNAIFRH